MKKILIIIPSLEVGGTIASLSALYNNIAHEYGIRILCMAHDDERAHPFADAMLRKDKLIHAYCCSFSKIRKFSLEKIFVFVVKLLKKLASCLNWDLENQIYSRHAERYEGIYDIIIGFQEGCATRLASHFKTSKKIAWIHCDYSRYEAAESDLPYYDMFDKIVCVSDFTADMFRSNFSNIKVPVQTIHNMIDTNRIYQLSQNPIDDLRFTRDKFIIISVGRVNPVKRFSQIPKVARGLLDMGLVFRWYIIGPEYGDDCFRNLLEEISANGVEDTVIYLGEKKNPYPYFKASDLLVCLSSTEACPMIFQEAKYLSVPVITTDFGSSREFITNGYDGVIAPLETITDAIAKMMNSSEEYNKIKQAIGVSDYTNSIIAKSINELLS